MNREWEGWKSKREGGTDGRRERKTKGGIEGRGGTETDR